MSRRFEKNIRGRYEGGGTAYRLSLTDLILMGVIEVSRAFDPGMLEGYKKEITNRTVSKCHY